VAPRRADYKTRKEYRWAKKVEQREYIRNAPSIPSAVIVSVALWFAVVILGSVIFGGVGGAIGLAVGVPIEIVFYRRFGSKINEVWNTKEIAERQRNRHP
jgi:hypothetical protein